MRTILQQVIASALVATFTPCGYADTSPVLLQDGTPVRTRLNRNLSSADAQQGETVDFEVLDEVKAGDVVVIPRGATAIGTVTEAKSKRTMGRAGHLNVTIDYVRSAS